MHAPSVASDGYVIEINDAQQHLAVPHPLLQACARLVLAEEQIAAASISISLVDDAGIHRLNARFLGHDQPTDVITFPLSNACAPMLAGEIVISAETAAREGPKHALNPREELCLYLIHGLLHLCGYDDQQPLPARAMQARQSALLTRFARCDASAWTPAESGDELEGGGRCPS